MVNVEVSIIVPVYNKAKYLKEIIFDISNQTFNDFECLIIDDGSFDGSEKICDQFSRVDKRFKVFHIVNSGVSNARNLGIDNAKGKYITFIDADDRININYLKNLMTCIENEKVDMVVGSYKKFWDNNDNMIEVSYENNNKKLIFSSLVNNFVEEQIRSGIFGCCVAKIFKRSLIEDLRFDSSISLAEDLDFYLKLYPRIKTIYFDDKAFYYYRQEAENSSSLVNDYDIDYLSQLKINLKLKKFLCNMNCYNGNNKLLIDSIIMNYVFFSIFYSPMESIISRCNKLKNIVLNEEVDFFYKEINKQTIILFLFHRHYFFLIKVILVLYRKYKKIEI